MADVTNIRRLLPDEYLAEQKRGHKWIGTALGFPYDFPNGAARYVTAKTKEEVKSRAIRYVQRANAARASVDRLAKQEMRKLGWTDPDRWHSRERAIRQRLRPAAYRSVTP